MQNDKFWGSKKVVNITKLSHQTPTGKDVYKISFLEGGFEFTTEEAYNLFSTDKKTDETVFVKLREKTINEKVAALLLDLGGMKHIEIEYFTTGLKNKLLEAFNRADNILWTGDDKLFTPGYDGLGDRSLLEADVIMKNNGILSETDVESAEPKK